MTIRDEGLYMKGIWDWACLDGCFGQTKIKPTDIDGCVERNGHKLYIETKQPGVPIPQGQLLTLKSFVDDGHTVVIVWGKAGAPERMRLIKPFDFDKEKATDLDGFRLLVSQWYQFANGNEMDRSDPAKMARAFWRRKGRAYCDILIAELARLDEQQQRTG